MKKLLIILFLFSNFKAFSQGLFKITGQIKNPTEKKISITLYRNWVEEEETYEINLDAAHRFKFEVNLTGVAYIDFYYADESFHYWIAEPGDNMNVVFDAKRFWESFLVTGKGNQKWIYSLQEHKKFEEDHDWRFQADTWRKLSMEKYFENLDAEQATQIAFLNTYKNLVSSDFFELRKADIVGEIQGTKVNFLSSPKFKDMDEEEVKVFIKNDNLNPKATSISLEYGNLQMSIIEMTTTKFAERKNRKPSEIEEYNFIKANYISNEIDRELTERLLAFKLKLYLEESGTTPERQQLVNDYVNFTMNRDYKNFIVGKADFLKTLKAGLPAKPFSLLDIDGKEVKLEDFKGKIVLIDFWASWCGPCIYDIKLMEEVKTFYKNNKNVVFIYISIDKEDEWRESVKQYDVKGINLRTDENSSVAKDYGVLGIPSYFLIDKKGNFAVSKVADPSEDDGKELLKQIEAALR